jgi:hypothetical protein
MDTLRNRLGGLLVEDDNSHGIPDTLAIALCSYFEDHVDRPDDDPIDDELGWGKWVVAKVEAAIDRLVAEASRKPSREDSHG